MEMQVAPVGMEYSMIEDEETDEADKGEDSVAAPGGAEIAASLLRHWSSGRGGGGGGGGGHHRTVAGISGEELGVLVDCMLYNCGQLLAT